MATGPLSTGASRRADHRLLETPQGSTRRAPRRRTLRGPECPERSRSAHPLSASRTTAAEQRRLAVYSGRQEPKAFEPGGAWTLLPATAAALKERYTKIFPLPPGEPPWEDSILEALATELRASDATSGSRDRPSIRVPAGASEDMFYSRIGRPIFNASSIYAPTLVIGGAADGVVPPEYREALLRDLVHAPVKREVIVPGGTHLTQFQRRRDDLFRAVEAFLAEPMPAQPAR